MTYQPRVSSDGSLPLSETIVQASGIQPGDRVVVETKGNAIVVKRDTRGNEALLRLRHAMRGYSVEQFLRERNGDWGKCR